MDATQSFEYGRHLQSAASQPPTSLVAPEDLSFCASRVLMLAQFVRRSTPQLSELIENVLGDLAGLRPDSAFRRVRDDSARWESSPVFWTLACHMLSHTLAEFSKDTPAETLTELRSSLGDWFPRLRKTLEVQPRPLAEVHLVCLQTYLTLAAIFHDLGAMRWGVETLMGEVVKPELLTGALQLECAGMAAGILTGPSDEPRRMQIAGVLDQIAATNPQASELRKAIGGVVTRDPLQSTTSVRSTKGKRPKSGGPSFVGGLLESYGWLLPWAFGLLVVGSCVWGFGKFYDWFEGSSHVGNQSLGQFYERMEANNEEKKGGGDSSNTDTMVAAPTPIESWPTQDAPASTPANGSSPTSPSPAPKMVSGNPAQLDKIVARHTAWLRPQLIQPRKIVSSANAPTYFGKLINADKNVLNGTATVRYNFTWFENGEPVGVQWIESEYKWENGEWQLASAVRCLNEQDIDGSLMYVTDSADRQWAMSLFKPNPFYPY